MVYCAKPSKACAECRSRRTKCDARRPACSQCMRAHRNCWGYIDPISSMFRNENTEFKDISHHTTAGTPLIHGPAWASTSYPISPLLSPSCDEQVTCFFFQNYVLQDTCASRWHFDFLPTLYQNFKVNKVLEDAVVALGLAGLANKTKVSNVMVKATVEYDTTVRAVRSVLGEEEEAKSDQTWITVMLLSLYEIITSGAPRSIRYWTQHIKGAISILRLRGEAQLHTEVGRRLFIQLRSQVITTCIHRRLAVPEEIHEWTSVAKQYETIQEHSATHMAEIAMRICALRSSMEDFRDHSSAVSVVSQALEIENAFSEWVTKLPTQYFYNTVTIFQRCEEVFSDHYHVYDGVCIATTWTSYRSLRIVLNEILVEQMIHLCQAQFASPEPSTELIDFYRSRTRACQALVRQLTSAQENSVWLWNR